MSQFIQYCKCDLKYEQLNPIDVNLLAQIQLVFIYTDSSGADVFIVTKTDEVYAYGTNKNGRLGLGHNNEVKKPTIVTELWGKGVKDIQCGHKFAIALTESGHIYVFGREFNGSTEEVANKINKPLLVTTIDDLVTEIKCMNNSYVVLTATGQLFWFGYRLYDEQNLWKNFVSEKYRLISKVLLKQKIIRIWIQFIPNNSLLNFTANKE